jgi:hypothetical protein
MHFLAHHHICTCIVPLDREDSPSAIIGSFFCKLLSITMSKAQKPAQLQCKTVYSGSTQNGHTHAGPLLVNFICLVVLLVRNVHEYMLQRGLAHCIRQALQLCVQLFCTLKKAWDV